MTEDELKVGHFVAVCCMCDLKKTFLAFATLEEAIECLADHGDDYEVKLAAAWRAQEGA